MVKIYGFLVVDLNHLGYRLDQLVEGSIDLVVLVHPWAHHFLDEVRISLKRL